MQNMKRLIEEWSGQAVITRYDQETGAWIFIALHDHRLGVPVGGTRMMVYPSPEDGMLDAMRLAEGMTYKWASIAMDFGGGKAVLTLSRPLSGTERVGLLKRYAELLNALNGSYITGEDLGTTPEDMTLLMKETVHVLGRDEQGQARDPGPYTARGVLAGIRAAVAHVYGDPSLAAKRILVQGVGDVGGRLARSLAEQGAVLLLSDLDEDRAQAMAQELGARVIRPERVYKTDCDVYTPCAIGATLNRESIPLLRCRIVAGSANNQLREPADADRLLTRDILYAPDYVINAGGAIAFGLFARGIVDESLIGERIDCLGETLANLFTEAIRQNESPLTASRRQVDRALAK